MSYGSSLTDRPRATTGAAQLPGTTEATSAATSVVIRCESDGFSTGFGMSDIDVLEMDYKEYVVIGLDGSTFGALVRRMTVTILAASIYSLALV